MKKLKKYQLVNNCETLQEIADVIRQISVDGLIKGKTQSFDSEVMAKRCENFILNDHNLLTKNFGIRQQAMMIVYYDSLNI